MNENFLGKDRRVLLAVNFDENTDALCKSAENLCKKLKLSLRIIHAAEPEMGMIGIGQLPVWQIEQVYQSKIIAAANEKLAGVIDGFSKDLEIEGAVIRGSIVDAILSETVTSQSCMLMIAAPAKVGKFIPEGVSVSLSLLGHSSIPVLAIPNQYYLDDDDLSSILVADDLSIHGESAFKFGYEFAKQSSAKLTHVYANSVEKEYLENGLNLAAASGRTTIDPQISADELYKALETIITDRLNKRSQTSDSNFDRCKVRYEQVILHGEPSECLSNYLSQNFPSGIACFGRHLTLHRKPFLIGRVPFRTMLGQHLPIVVVP